MVPIEAKFSLIQKYVNSVSPGKNQVGILLWHLVLLHVLVFKASIKTYNLANRKRTLELLYSLEKSTFRVFQANNLSTTGHGRKNK